MSFKAQPKNVFCLKKLCACLLLGSASAFAAESELTDLSLDQLLQVEVQTVSKYAQTLEKVPAIVTVVSGEDFKRYGWRTVVDMLRTVPGFFVSNPTRLYEHVGVSGLNAPKIYNEDILVMLNGHRMNENTFDQGLLGDTSIFDVALIDHVEIIRGPASSVYGANALLGVVNVVYKKGKDFSGGEIGISYGSGNDRMGRATYGMQLDNGADFLISAHRQQRDGFSLTVDNAPIYQLFGSSPTANNIDQSARTNFFSSLNYENYAIDVASYVRNAPRATGFSFQTLNDPRNFSEDRHSSLDLKAKYNLATSSDLSARFFYDADDYADHSTAEIPTGIPSPDLASLANLLTNSNHSSLKASGVDIQLLNTSFRGQKIILGTEYIDRFLSKSQNIQGQILSKPLKKYGVYLQDEINATEHWDFTIGGRCDNNGIVSRICSPRLAIVGNYESLGSFKALYGSAFRSPNLYESTITSSNTSLGTERIKSLTLSWDNPSDSYFRLHADIYRYNMNQLIGGNLDVANLLSTLNYIVNLGDVDAYGGVMSLARNWSPDSGFKLSYNYNHARLPNDQVLNQSPDHLIQGDIHFSLAPHWSAAYELQYVSGQLSQGADPNALFNFQSIRKKLPSQFVNNISLRYTPSKTAPELTLSVYNLFDRNLVDPAADGVSPGRIVTQQPSREYRAAILIPF